MIENFTCGKFSIKNKEGMLQYCIDDRPIELVELPSDSIERITLEVLREMYDRENSDSGLRWEQ